MKPVWTRRQWTWYGLFILAVLAGFLILDRAMAVDDRPIVLALVFVGIGFAVGIGVLAVVSAWRER